MLTEMDACLSQSQNEFKGCGWSMLKKQKSVLLNSSFPQRQQSLFMCENVILLFNQESFIKTLPQHAQA